MTSPTPLPTPWPPNPNGAAYPTARGTVSNARRVLGILVACGAGFAGCFWFMVAGLMLAYPEVSPADAQGAWVVVGALGLLVAGAGVGGLGMAITARRPAGARSVQVWVGLSSVCGGLLVLIVAIGRFWLNVTGA